jgi:protein-tyrosine phosphatase
MLDPTRRSAPPPFTVQAHNEGRVGRDPIDYGHAVIDLHTHILPGIDDGAATLEASIELARSAAEAGVVALAATPHVREDFRTTAGAMEAALSDVRAAVERAGLPTRILPGGEVGMEYLDQLSLDELRRFGLGGNPDYLLVETPYFGVPLDLDDRLRRLRSLGITAVLAHPERSIALREKRDLLSRLVQAGTLVQVTAGSLNGAHGRDVRKAALALVDSGLAHCVASDAHGRELGRPQLDVVASAVGSRAVADWLTQEVPASILAGEPLPPRPRRSRFLWLRAIRS